MEKLRGGSPCSDKVSRKNAKKAKISLSSKIYYAKNKERIKCKRMLKGEELKLRHSQRADNYTSDFVEEESLLSPILKLNGRLIDLIQSDLFDLLSFSPLGSVNDRLSRLSRKIEDLQSKTFSSQNDDIKRVLDECRNRISVNRTCLI